MSREGFILAAVTPPYIYPDEGAAIERALAEGGFDYVHIRKPGADADAIAALTAAVDPALRHRLTLHDHHELALPTGCGGIHLNSRNPIAPAGWSGRLSRSCHTIEEVQEAVGYDYVTLSPIYPSISKPGYRSSIADDPRLPMALASAPSPVVALGGVTPAKLAHLEQSGFGGAAMLGAAWRSPALAGERFRLQFVTHPYPSAGITDGTRMALAGGCRWIQLRHKGADTATLVDEGRLIASMRAATPFTFIIDDRADLVDAIGADGVHLGKNDMPVAEARQMLGPGKIIGATANTAADIVAAARAGADYIGLGPFRFTTTKERLSPVLGTEGYRDIIGRVRAQGITLPIVAIGGITPSDVAPLMGAGADGVAVSGAIAGAPDPVGATRLFMQKTLNITNI